MLTPLLLSPGATIREAVEVIDTGERRTALVVDHHFRLLGIIRDADLRRGLLHGLGLEAPAAGIMNAAPIVGRPDMDRAGLLRLMQRTRHDMLPIVDGAGRLVGVESLTDVLGPVQQDAEVVLMAGGFGKRLAPLTHACPKPLLTVGQKPILETIVESFAEQGFRRFWISVNYLGEMIEQYFGDGSRWDVEIGYLREDRPLGTAGGLGLLPQRPRGPLIVMNGDILTRVHFGDLLRFHKEAGAAATMCVREHEIGIPYGVVEADGQYLNGIQEKPRHSAFVNAGIYVLNPEVLAALPPDHRCDMPDVLADLTAQDRKVALFPIREYWLDIGQMEQFRRANLEFSDQFGEEAVPPRSTRKTMKPALLRRPPADDGARKICVVTGSRADYGLLYWVMREIDEAPDLALRLIATGMHLSPRFGETWRVIAEDDFRIDESVPIDLDDDSPIATARATGLAAAGFADAYERLKPDMVLLLGDRFEILAAAQAAMLAGLPIAHLCGGDVTEGAFDDAIRHAVSKMAQLHFVTNADSARRLCQMGEDPASITISGNPGLDHLGRLELLDRAAFEKAVGMTLRPRNLLITFHPETLSGRPAERDAAELLSALDALGPEVGLIVTRPNADPGNRPLIAALEVFAKRPNVTLQTSLGQRLYFSAMAQVDAMVGNSSSGLMEMPSFGKPTVNIGGRQDGRPRAASVIDVPLVEAAAIRRAIERAFALDCSGVANPYGDGKAAARIVKVLRQVTDTAALRRKRFHDSTAAA